MNDMDNTSTVAKQLAGKSWLHFTTRRTTASVVYPSEERSCEIVFHDYGDSYFLSEILTAGEETGQELAPSRDERRLRSEMASNKAEPETVAVAAY